MEYIGPLANPIIDPNIGKIIGKYEILELTGKTNSRGNPIYRCKCIDCGYDQCEHDLETIKKSKAKTRCSHKYWVYEELYSIYTGMIKKCNPDNNEKRHQAYYNKRIGVCYEWLNQPYKFVEWALKNGYVPGLTLSRLDKNKGYYPENCRFVSYEENSKWTSNTKVIPVNGIYDSCAGWDKRLNLPEGSINRYCNKNGYIPTAQYISSIFYRNLINPITIVDEDAFNNKKYY